MLAVASHDTSSSGGRVWPQRGDAEAAAREEEKHFRQAAAHYPAHANDLWCAPAERWVRPSVRRFYWQRRPVNLFGWPRNSATGLARRRRRRVCARASPVQRQPAR